MSRDNFPPDSPLLAMMKEAKRRQSLTPAQLREEWEAKRHAVAQWLGVSDEEADDLLDRLPFSDIPDWTDVEIVATWFIERGER